MRHSVITTGILLAAGMCWSAQAQQTEAAMDTHVSAGQRSPLAVPAGENLHVVIPRGFRVKGLNQPVTGKVTESIFVGDREVIAPGTVIQGRITSLASAGGRARLGRLLGGDLTPPRVASVTFDELDVTGHPSLALNTEAATQMPGTKMSLYRPKRERPGRKEQARTQISAIVHTPNKLQRISEGVVTALPLHPEFLDEGTRFNAHLSAPLVVDDASLPLSPATPNVQVDSLRVRLLTPLDSEEVRRSQQIEAVTAAPFYDGQTLVYPAGARLTGSVTRVKAAGWFQRQGAMNFHFSSIEAPGRAPQPFDARVIGIEAAKGQALAVDEEGALRATDSPIRRIAATLSLLGPSRALADPSLSKTAFQRGGQGRNGFGLLGSGAAQASASAAAGFGYYAAARKLYANFVAKGSDVDLPADTTILVAANR